MQNLYVRLVHRMLSRGGSYDVGCGRSSLWSHAGVCTGSGSGGASARDLAQSLFPGPGPRAHSAPPEALEDTVLPGGGSPFEHVVLDAALGEVCRRLAADAAELQADTYPAVEELMQVRPSGHMATDVRH